MDGKFETTINPKDGHAVSDYIDPRKRKVLEFVIPIQYLEKPNRAIKEVDNIVFGARLGNIRLAGVRYYTRW